MKSTSTTKPSKFTFERYPRGGYILWLRDNFSEITETDEYGETQTSWIYDEYTMLVPSSLSDTFIERHFDEYISEAKKQEANKLETRICTVEDAIADIADLLSTLLGGTSND